MPRIKICGLTDGAAYDAAADADWVGFVFASASPRAIAPAQAAALAQRSGPARVGLFVAPEDDAIAAVLAVLPLDVLQLHAVTPDRAAAIRRRFDLPVWRAVGVATAADLPRTPEVVDALLLDAKPPSGADLPGGNARAFDWSLLRGWTAPMPWLLAGGLTPGNVAGAVRETGATAVDVSSGVERERGVKDPALIRAFVRAARGAATANPGA